MKSISNIPGSTNYHYCKKYNARYWCATAVDAGGRYTDWDYCDETQCPLEGQVTVNPPALATEGAGEVTTDTISSDECLSVNGLPCIFPFKSGREIDKLQGPSIFVSILYFLYLMVSSVWKLGFGSNLVPAQSLSWTNLHPLKVSLGVTLVYHSCH